MPSSSPATPSSQRPVRKLFESLGHSFTHVACHLVHEDFPKDLESIRKYDVVILSDIGSNTMLLHPDYLNRRVNSLTLIRDYVASGGGFVMIGGYFSFTGFQAKARYHGSAVEDVLPVTLQPYDDRVEIPEGINLKIDAGVKHPIIDGLPKEWPHIFGYNKLKAKPDAEVLLAANGGDPIIAAGSHGKGRAVAYATDCAQDWASPQLLNWDRYGQLWDQLLRWVGENNTPAK